MVTSYKTKTGIRWRVAIRSSKYPHHFKGGFLNARDARDFEKVILSELIRGVFAPVAKSTIGTLADALNKYQAEIPEEEPFRKVKINRINAWLKSPLAMRAITSLKRSDFRDWRSARRSELRADGTRQISDSSIYKNLVIIIGLWTHAKYEWDEMLGDCPAKLTTESIVRLKRNRAKPEKPRIDPSSEKTICEIFSRPGHNPYFQPIFSFALETSIRAHELIQLHWVNVHWDAGVIYVPAHISKSGLERWVSLSDEAVLILRRTPCDIAEPRIFPISRSALSSGWARAKEDEKFPKKITFHSTRHEALTRLAEAKLSINQLMEMSGHKTLAMLMVYLNKGNAQETRTKIVEAKRKSMESSPSQCGGAA